MPAIPVISALAALTGVAQGIHSLTQGSPEPQANISPASAPEIPALTPEPTPIDAEARAKAELEKQRKMRALAGGKTILAEGGPDLTVNTGKTLLGS